MYGGNVVTQVCPITVAMFITSALLVACDISDGLIWSPSMNYEPNSAARRVAVGRSGALTPNLLIWDTGKEDLWHHAQSVSHLPHS